MNFILFDDQQRGQLFPFTQTRAVADILCGIWTMQERWNFYLKAQTTILTEEVLQDLYTSVKADEDAIYINAAYFANTPLIEAFASLQRNEILIDAEGQTIAIRLAETCQNRSELFKHIEAAVVKHILNEDVTRLTKVWDIFKHNDFAIRSDFDAIQVDNYSQKIPEYVTIVGNKEDVFVSEGAILGPCIINAHTGPVYIGKGAEVMEGCMLRGPLALKAHAVLKMGAKVYGATTIGEGSKVGGEVNNVVIFNNSNKGHDGFIGNAVIGEWCNLGADTNCSNLKNNYDTVKVWNIEKGIYESTGLQFCGLIMGDHSKCGINTMFNTGTVVGVSANVFGANFPDKYIPSFTWGGVDTHAKYQFDKAVATANRMMERRGKRLTPQEEKVLHHIFEENL